MNINIRILMVYLLFITSNVVSAYVEKVHSECQFYRTINKRSLALVFLYNQDKEARKDLRLKNKVCASLACLERMSRLPWYQDGDCIFIAINVTTQDLRSLTASLGVTRLPAYMLFYNSVPVRNDQGQAVRLTGFVPRNLLESFIDRYVGGTLEDNVKERAEQRRIAREDARLRYEYYAPYFYWGYPYWGGCCCPGFGVGVGFGCGY